MKRTLSFLLALLTLSVVAMAQAPVKFNYQTLVRDVAGNLVGNHLVHVKISILAGSFEGEVKYSEHSSAMTDRSGWMTLVVGDGVVIEGSLDQIDWAKGPYFMHCDIDPKGGNNYAISSAQQLLSVPYALYAGGGDYNKLSNLPDIKAMIRQIVKEEASNLYQESQSLSDVAAISNSMGNRQLKELSAPTDNQDAVTLAYMKRYVDSVGRRIYDSSYLAAASLSQNVVVSSDGRVRKKAIAAPTPAKDGVLMGEFSVSGAKKVRFSQGNLQYAASGRHAVADGGTKSGTWRFAPSQYNESVDNKGQWLSLHEWNSTGCNDDGTLGDACFDWGLYNAISNGGNMPGQWRLLTIDEWNYLRSQRRDARNKFAFASVDGHAGMVLLPDSWQLPADLYFVPGAARGFATNIYDAGQWSAMEAAGAVFLPASGNSNAGQVNNAGTYGSYWSSSLKSNGSIYSLDFYGTGIQTTGNQPSIGQSVRLVQEM
ncbi:MAG: hypothetical protein IJ620_01650 [Bacteroidales bacterium]|nr:hypothetical protein [Bacteroidales bacterium]